MFIVSKPILILASVTLLAVTGGCIPLGVLMDKADPTTPAMYVPVKENLVVLVEDYQNPALVEIIAEHMNRQIGEELIAHTVAPVVNPDKLSVLRSERAEEYKKMKITVIGSEVGARQILYVDITQFSMEGASGSEAVKAHAEARVKIVDCITGQTRWPRDGTSAGYLVIVDLPFGADLHNVNTSSVRNALGAELSTRIAKLFYEAPLMKSENVPSYPESDMR
jgi:hypothetical protein